MLVRPSLGFVMIRHVRDSLTNEYWQESYRTIRQFYDHPILIIDDHSDPQFIQSDLSLVNCQIITSDFIARGELLAYYYFERLHPFDHAVIIHDSVFFTRHVEFDLPATIRFMWFFTHEWDTDLATINLMTWLDDAGPAIRLYTDKIRWVGCFGAMSIIRWDFIHTIAVRHRLFETLGPHLQTRTDRMSVERILAVLAYLNDPNLQPNQCSLWGNIIKNYSFDVEYSYYKAGRLAQYPMAKVFTGR